MNTLKILAISAFLAIFAFASFPAVAHDSTATPKQVEQSFEQLIERLEQLEKALLVVYGYEWARGILGDDFIMPEEVAQARNLRYSDAHLALFRETLPSREVLEWLESNDYMLVAGPPTVLSLLNVRRLDDTLFYFKSGKGWYAADNEHFSRTDTVGSTWLALRKSPVPDSTDKTWNEQFALLSDDERVPNVAEVAWGLTTYKEVRDVNLSFFFVRTSSVASDGGRVVVFGPLYFQGYQRGLDFGRWLPGDSRYSGVGVSSARKLLQ